MKYTAIIGLDFGDGETAAMMVRPDRPGVFYALSLSQDADKTIPTVIHYDEGQPGKINIGKNATNKEGMVAHFKCAPADWYLEDGQEALFCGRSRRAMMRDFIGEVMRGIMRYNTKSALEKDDKVLLVVGCPASWRWYGLKNRKAYEALVREATGMEDVVIAPESRAAIFSTYIGREDMRDAQGNRIRASDGIAVFDFGSLTADFTYVKMGEELIERSWEFGAGQIERIMLRRVLEQGQVKEEAFYARQEGLLLQKLRLTKEMYYSDELYSKRQSIDLICVDEYGEPILEGNNAKGRKQYKTLELRFPEADSDMNTFMEGVAAEETFPVYMDGNPIAEGSWEANCLQFLNYVKDLLRAKGLGLRMIVLTGGACKMPFIRRLARKVFEDCKVEVETNPSFTVARGLCLLGKFDGRVSELVEKDLPVFQGIFLQAFRNGIASILPGIVPKIHEKVLAYLQDAKADITLGQLKDELGQLMKRAVEQSDLEGRIKGMLPGMIDELLEKHRTAIANVARELYGEDDSVGTFAIDGRRNARVLEKTLLKADFAPRVLEAFDPEDFVNLTWKEVVSFIAWLVAAVLLVTHPFLAGGILVGEDLLSKGIKKFIMIYNKLVIKRNQLHQVAESLSKPEKKKEWMDKLAKNLEDRLMQEASAEGEFKKELENCARQTLGAIYRSVALLSFEHADLGGEADGAEAEG